MQKLPKARVLVSMAFLALALAAVGGRLYGLQVIHRSEVMERNYIDRATLARMNRLLNDGVLSRKEDGTVRVAGPRLHKAVARPAIRKRIKDIAAQAYLKPGQMEFDRRLCVVQGPGARIHASQVLRGRILDGRGQVLAETKLESGNGNRRRFYPLGAAGQHLIGFHHPIFGSLGLEANLNKVLSTSPPKGQGVLNLMSYRRLSQGTDVYLTVDSRLQKSASTILGERKGAAVILDTRTGAVLAALGNPAFDPNNAEVAKWRKVREKEHGMLLRSKAWQTLYPPGSIFKLIVAAAWLETRPGEAGQAPVIHCGGRDSRLNISDIHAHGTVDLDRALARSCNVYFARLGVSLGSKVRDTAQRFGFNRSFDLIPQLDSIDLKSEPSLAYALFKYSPGKIGSTGRIKRKLDLFRRFARDYKIAAQCAIGQNLIQATPLQMAVVAQAIANDGFMFEPHLIKGIGAVNNLKDFKALGAAPGRQVLRPATAHRLGEMMTEVMRTGTGRHVPKLVIGEKEILVAGKTGTAETGQEGEPPHSWFMGFAPADAPRFAIALIVENGGLGGKTAAPLANRMLHAALKHGDGKPEKPHESLQAGKD